MPDIRTHSPTDFGRDLGAHLGLAFSLEPILSQSAWFRTHPGAGIPGVLGSAEAATGLMLA